jgi:hypothetical protein
MQTELLETTGQETGGDALPFPDQIELLSQIYQQTGLPLTLADRAAIADLESLYF